MTIACVRRYDESGDEGVEISKDAVVVRATEKAILVDCEELEQVWIPKSVVHDDSETYDESTEGNLIVKRWYATKQGWA